MSKRFMFACGGTAGHIYPAIAVAGELEQLLPGSEFLFVGAEGKMETDLVPQAGYNIETLKVTNLRRGFSLSGIAHNLGSAKNLAGAMGGAKRLICGFSPDAVIGTGGYVCFPVIRQAAKLGIPTAIHEANATPGLTTRMLERSSKLIMVGFEECRAGYIDPDKVIVTGTPVRGSFFDYDTASAKARLGLTDKPLVVSFWGSLGASHMNEMTADMIKLNYDVEAFYHIHATGGGDQGLRDMRELLWKRRIDDENERGIDVRSFIYDMPLAMAAADIILCRAGASTLSELMALGKPSVLVPSPFVTNDHQTKNAALLAKRGGAILQPQSECSGQRLFDTVMELFANRVELNRMAENAYDPEARKSALGIARSILPLL